MTLNENIDKLEASKQALKASIESKGIVVPADTKIEGYAAKIDEITGGGGGIDLTGTGWETEPVFPVNVARLNNLQEDINLTRKMYSEWNPANTTLKDFLEQYSVKGIAYIPKIDTQNVTSLERAFPGLNYFTTIPALNTSKVTNMAFAFHSCRTLEELPVLDTSKVLDMSSCFYNCAKIKRFPKWDTSNVKNFLDCFALCEAMEEAPDYDTRSAESMYRMFTGCKKLKTIPAYDTSNATNMGCMFWDCQALETIPELEAGKVITSIILKNCPNLTNIGGFKNFGNLGFKLNLLDSGSTKITHQSLLNVINDLAEVKSSSEEMKPQLILGEAYLAQLSEEEKNIAINKGWKLV